MRITPERLNAIAPGIIVTLLALCEFIGLGRDVYKNVFARCPAGRPGTADEAANVAELLLSDQGAFISGSTFLIDVGATASCFYGPLMRVQRSDAAKNGQQGEFRKREPLCCFFASGRTCYVAGCRVWISTVRPPRCS